MRFLIIRLLAAGFAPPNLTTEGGVVVDDSDADAALGGAGRSRLAGGASTDHEDIEMLTLFPAHRFTSRC